MSGRLPCRLLRTGIAEARHALALSAALASSYQRLEAGAVLRLHRFRPAAILGRHSDAAAEVDIGWCRANGVDVARRPTGGGAVYMDPGILCWELLLSAREAGHDLEGLMARGGAAMVSALSACGTAVRFSPPGTLLTDAGKAGGVAGLSDGACFLLQGTLILSADMQAMARCLRRPVAPVVALGDPAGVEEALVFALTGTFALDLRDHAPDGRELALAEQLFETAYGRDDFVLSGALAEV